MKNKINNVKNSIVSFFRRRSMSTHLILTIGAIFLSFFALQLFLNSQFFQQYYTQREFESVHSKILIYVDAMNEDDANYYDEMYKFTTETNAYSVLVTRSYRIQGSMHSNYSITMIDTNTSEEHTFLVPNNDYSYNINQVVSVEAYEYTEDLFAPVAISIPGEYNYDSGIKCDQTDCIDVLGPITEVRKPENLNPAFEGNITITQELNKLSSGTIDLFDIEYEHGYYYETTNNGQDYLVFMHELGSFDFIVTVVPIENTDNIISIVNSYNNYVYLTAIAIILIWSMRLTTTISKPVQNIESVARQISDLNFNVVAEEYNNRENTSLSNSINLIAKNLKETLSTLTDKNNELLGLYDEQVKQVTLKKQLVSSISHELKTPLMIMQVTIQGILDGIIDEEEKEKELMNVIEEINKSSMMIGDMLQIYRLDDANTVLEISEFNLSQEVFTFINDFENVLRQHEFKLDLNLDNQVLVEADLKLIKRVISNFFTNAIKYTPEGERIYIEVSSHDDKVYFELTNYGSTIPEEDLENIWIPFFRGQAHSNNSRLKTKGSGIGLYLVSEILKAHEADFGISNISNGVQAFFEIKQKQTND